MNWMLKLLNEKETCLKMEISQSHDWVGNAMKKQTAALNHTTATIAITYLDNFWVPCCISNLEKSATYLLLLGLVWFKKTFSILSTISLLNSCKCFLKLNKPLGYLFSCLSAPQNERLVSSKEYSNMKTNTLSLNYEKLNNKLIIYILTP